MHWLRHHPHLRVYFADHLHQKYTFISTCKQYPTIMHHNLASSHYTTWLLHYLLSHHRLPGIDLLLGA